MKIENKTDWNTKDIKRLICRVAKDELDAGQLKQLKVYVNYRRINGYAGHGAAPIAGDVAAYA